MALRLPFRHIALRCYFDAMLPLYNYRTLITRPLPMKLPFAHRLRVDESKIVGYLLSQSSGQGKAAFFLGFGFQPEKWMALADALRTQARRNPVVAEVDSSYGTRYSVDGELETPDGRRPRVRTVWILERDSDEPRLITAHPV